MSGGNWQFHDPEYDAPGQWFDNQARDISRVATAEAAARIYAYDLDDQYVLACPDIFNEGREILAKSPEGVVSRVRLKAWQELRFEVEVLGEENQI